MINPDLSSQFQALRANGDYLPAHRDLAHLSELTFDHPDGARDIAIDVDTLRTQGRIYIGNQALRQTLEMQGFPVGDVTAAYDVIAEQYDKDELVVGFSGFATPGFGYETEAEGIVEVHEYLAATGRRPGLVVDGGVSAGNLGLSAVVAAQNEVSTIGFIPLEGLDSVGARDHMVVWGNTYPDREVMVGTTPDVLVCVGGGEGTKREGEVALVNGSAVLLLALKEYGPNSLPATYRNNETWANAMSEARAAVCESLETLPEKIETVVRAVDASNRDKRLRNLGENLRRGI